MKRLAATLRRLRRQSAAELPVIGMPLFATEKIPAWWGSFEPTSRFR